MNTILRFRSLVSVGREYKAVWPFLRPYCPPTIQKQDFPLLYITHAFDSTMESFLEANRVVEVSLNKFSHVSKRQEMPLRKALLISKAMNRAQEAAESAHTCFINSVSTTRCSSRLLASMQSSADIEDTAVSLHDPGLLRPVINKPRLPSPVAMAQRSSSVTVKDDDMMDMETVISANSVLSDILSSGEDDASAMEVSTPLGDLSNSRDWSATWPEVAPTQPVKPLPLGTDTRWTAERTSPSPPPSPGKRHHSVAFPSIASSSSSLFDFTEEDPKRFKPSFPENTSPASLPGLYGCLSPRNLCSAPLITYMFGRGFNTPSDPSESDWPTTHTTTLSTNSELFDSHHFSQTLSPQKLCPILAY